MENETITQIINYLSALPKTLTVKLTEIFINQGWNVSERWTGTLLFFLAILIFYIGIKIATPAIKWILIILGALLLIGLIIPFW